MFRFSDQHIEEFTTLGYTVFRNIVPAKLVDELRRECDRGAAIQRERTNPNAQRFQPIADFPIDLKPFEEFQNLESIRDAVSRIVQSEWEPSGLDVMGVLLEPKERAWCTTWHRDWRDNVASLDVSLWTRDFAQPELFNQVNCALYEDSCTWVVPGSHARGDSEVEIARFPVRPTRGPELEGLSLAEQERACLDYCESLPGAQRLLLDAGDFCLYRNTLWHLGNYIPYKKRATLHDAVMTPGFREWREVALASARERAGRGIEWERS